MKLPFIKKRGSAQAVRAPVRFDVQVVEINNRKFVSNLFWQPLSNARNYMAEARTLGKRHNWDIVAIRRGTRVQAGFAPGKSGTLKGTYSLAASLAAQLGDSWLGAFALRDGRYAVVAVHERMICTDFDQICTADEAKRLLREVHSNFQFDDHSIFAPPELEFASHSKDIYELLTPNNLRKDLRLKQLTFGLTKREMVLAASTVVLVGGAIAGVLWYEKLRAEEAARIAHARQLAQQKRLAELNEIARRKLGANALAHPWASTAGALDFAEACVAAEDQFPLSIAGWPLTSITCSANGDVDAKYKRNDGLTVEQFIAEAARGYGSVPAFSGEDLNVGIVKTKIRPPAAGDETLALPDVLLPKFHSHFEGAQVPLTMSEMEVKIPKEPEVQGQPPKPAPVPTWAQKSFSYSHELPPTYHFAQLRTAIGGLAGVRIDEVEEAINAEMGSVSWTVKGIIYVQK